MKKMIMLAMAFAAIVGLTIPAGATAGTYPGAQPTEIDQDWVQEALRIDLFEIKAGELAQKQASNPKVATLGEMLANDGTTAFAEGREVAKEIDAPVPTEPGPEMKVDLQKLAAAGGAAFDKLYPETEVAGQLEAIKKAEAEIGTGSDATVVDSATMNLAMYEVQLEAARDVM